jgi:hypothetical protein
MGYLDNLASAGGRFPEEFIYAEIVKSMPLCPFYCYSNADCISVIKSEPFPVAGFIDCVLFPGFVCPVQDFEITNNDWRIKFQIDVMQRV